MIPAIVIPAFNPPNTFINLIYSIRDITTIPIIIIDDGTHPAIHIDQKFSNVQLLRNNINKGKGYSILKGLNYAFSQNYTHCITLDSDSQHDPDLIPKFLSVDSNISIVCGKRSLIDPMPIHRRLSNMITSKIVTLLCNTKLFDLQCGYRRYRLNDVCNETFYEKGFQFETEVLIKLLHNNLKISHINIPTIYADERSAMRHFHDTFKFISLIIRTLR